jgi:hypothetical protein
LVNPVIDAKGGGNLLPRNIEPLVATLRAKQAEHIVILTDQEDAPDSNSVKQRITNQYTELIFVAVKAWLLAATQAVNCWLKQQSLLKVYQKSLQPCHG